MKSVWSICTSFTAAFALIVCATCAPTWAQQVSAPNEQLTLGTVVPEAWFFDERGDTLTLRHLAGKPLIVSPVFTTCPQVCPAITHGLAAALDGLGGCGQTFNVLTLSFDPDDSPEDLRAYRRRTAMPEEWILGTGVKAQVQSLMDAIDFRFDTLPGGGFVHANAVVFLTPDQAVSGYLHGLMYTQEEVKAALRKASGRRPLVDRARPFLIPVAAFFLITTLLIIVITARKGHPAT